MPVKNVTKPALKSQRKPKSDLELMRDYHAQLDAINPTEMLDECRYILQHGLKVEIRGLKSMAKWISDQIRTRKQRQELKRDRHGSRKGGAQ